MYYNGMEIILSEGITDAKKVRARKHKTKRIDKKFLKKYGYKDIQVWGKKMFVMGNKIYMHPKVFAKIKDSIM